MDLRNQRNLPGENIQSEDSHADLADFTGIYQCINALLSVSSIRALSVSV